MESAFHPQSILPSRTCLSSHRSLTKHFVNHKPDRRESHKAAELTPAKVASPSDLIGFCFEPGKGSGFRRADVETFATWPHLGWVAWRFWEGSLSRVGLGEISVGYYATEVNLPGDRL